MYMLALGVILALLKYLEIGLATAALYLVMSVPLGLLARRLEKKWAGVK